MSLLLDWRWVLVGLLGSGVAVRVESGLWVYLLPVDHIGGKARRFSSLSALD